MASQIKVDTITNAAGTAGPNFPSGAQTTTNIRASEGSGTTTLTISDNSVQTFNLSAARTVVLPTTGVLAGDVWIMRNRGNFDLTIQSSAANTIDTIRLGYCRLQALVATPTAASDWQVVEVYEHGSFTGTMTVGFSVNPGTVTYAFSRIGPSGQMTVILTPEGTQTGTSSGVVNPSIAGTPTRLVPTSQTTVSCASGVVDNSVTVVGYLIMQTDGTITPTTSGQGINSFSATTGGQKGVPARNSYVFKMFNT